MRARYSPSSDSTWSNSGLYIDILYIDPLHEWVQIGYGLDALVHEWIPVVSGPDLVWIRDPYLSSHASGLRSGPILWIHSGAYDTSRIDQVLFAIWAECSGS